MEKMIMFDDQLPADPPPPAPPSQPDEPGPMPEIEPTPIELPADDPPSIPPPPVA